MNVFRARRGPIGASNVPLAVTLGLAVLVAGSASVPAAAATAGKRSTLAVTYGDNTSTTIDLRGVTPKPGVLGKADVARKDGRTRVRARLSALPHPQDLGSLYTTYLLWAIAPEGQAASLAELPHSKKVDVEVTTAFQTFGLVVTAEPHGAVALPSPRTVAEGAARDDTRGRLSAGVLQYSSAGSRRYEVGGANDLLARDYVTPLLVLGAQRAVDLAQEAGAASYAPSELRRAETKLAALHRAWPRKGRLPVHLAAEAREVMRLSEHARADAEAGADQARLAAERLSASAQVARAETAAERARSEAAAASASAARERWRAEEARQQAADAKAAEERAKDDEQTARVLKEVAVAEAQRARQEAEQARRDKERMQQELFDKIAAILETRREARGLIVSLSDVLFDFDRATLTPGAREKLSKLAGVLLAYPAPFRLDLEGHTDSIGSAKYNRELSASRATSVRDYMMAAGVPAYRMGTTSGFGDERPVASNSSPAGRQMNRRVEIVISDLAG